MGNNSVPKFIFRLSRFPVYKGSVLGRFYCNNFKGEDLTLGILAIQVYETNQEDVIDEGIYHTTVLYNLSVSFLLELSKYSLNFKGTSVCLCNNACYIFFLNLFSMPSAFLCVLNYL